MYRTTRMAADYAEARTMRDAARSLECAEILVCCTGYWIDRDGNVAFCDGRQEIDWDSLDRAKGARKYVSARIDGGWVEVRPTDGRNPGMIHIEIGLH